MRRPMRSGTEPRTHLLTPGGGQRYLRVAATLRSDGEGRRGWIRRAVQRYLAVAVRVNALSAIPTTAFLFFVAGERSWEDLASLTATVFVIVNTNFLILNASYHYLWRPLASLRNRLAQRLLVALVLLILGPLGVTLGMFALSWAGIGIPTRPSGVVAIGIGFSILYGIAFFRLRDSRHERQEALSHLEAARRLHAELEEERSTARFTALQALVQPHFVFNALNSIAALIHEHPERAEKTTLDFARLMRRVLDVPDTGLVDLQAEFDIVRAYLELEQVRMGDRFTFGITLPPGLESRGVPAMLLQPLVENAVKHGARQRVDGGRVDVAAVETEIGWEVRVVDNGPGYSSAAGTGSGMLLVRERLSLFYGDAAELRLERDDARRETVVTLALPAPQGDGATAVR